MRIAKILTLASCLLVLGSASSWAANATCDEAKALMDKAIAVWKAEGQEKAVAKFMDKDGGFVDRDLYVFVMDKNAKFYSHAQKPSLVGKTGMGFKDADGFPFIEEFMKVKDSGSVNYRWADPLDNKVKNKTSYMQWVGDILIGVGCYKE